MNTSKGLALSLALATTVLSQEACEPLVHPETPDSAITSVQGDISEQCHLNFTPIHDRFDKMPHERPAKTTHWKTAPLLTKEIMKKVDGGEKVFLIIGNTSCEPCESTEKWWSTRSAGDFQTYHVKVPDEKFDSFDDEGLLSNFQGKAVPACLLIERTDKTTQKRRDQTIIKGVTGFPDCTGKSDNSIAAWMNQQCIQ